MVLSHFCISYVIARVLIEQKLPGVLEAQLAPE